MQLAMIFAILACWLTLATATSFNDPPQPRETLLIDNQIPVLGDNGEWIIMSQEEHLQHLGRRLAADVTTTIEIQVSTATAKPTTTTVVASPLPSPFDTVLAANFTGNGGNGACPAFINSFLANATFQACYPFSMLLQGSSSFFQAEKSLVSITQVLDASCKADNQFCQQYMTNLASNLTDDSHCGADYAMQNQVVVQAYEGLLAYQPIYSAACLKDPDDSAYCFASSVTNSSAVADVYFYYLPLNITFPNTTIPPTCNWCTQQTMGIFQSTTANRNSFIANTYVNASIIVNNACGSGFVNETLPVAAVTNAATLMLQAPSLVLLPLLVMAALQWLS
jgi:hypothetical protein